MPDQAPSARARLPKVGDIVLYYEDVSTNPFFGERTPNLVASAAIVTATGQNGVPADNVSLAVFRYNQDPRNAGMSVPYSAIPAHEHWSWRPE